MISRQALGRILCVTLLIGCSCGSTPTVLPGEVQRGKAVATEAVAEAEALWPERLDEAKLRAAIAAWRRAVAAADDDAKSWGRIAQASFFLADGIVAFDPARKDELVTLFGDGAAAAERGLKALIPEFERRRRDGAGVDEAAAALAPEAAAAAVPLLYWWGLNAIRWADLSGWTSAAATYKPVLHVIEQVQRVDPGYDNGGADRYLGSFYAEAPGMAGGDIEKSRFHYERALALAPGNLLTRVAFAEHYAKKTHDAKAYEETLRALRAADAKTPEDAVAKKKAARLPPRLE